MRFSFVASRLFTVVFGALLLGVFCLPSVVHATTFDFDSGVSGYSTSTVTQTVGGHTLQMDAVGDTIESTDWWMGGGLGGSANATGHSGNVGTTSLTISVNGGKAFDLGSFVVRDWSGGADTITVTSSKGSQSFSTDGNEQTINFTNPNLNGITSFTMTSNNGALTIFLDTIVLNNIVAPPTVTGLSPTSGASGTSVTLTGTNFTGVTAVTFGGTAASSFTVNSATSITATAPAGTGTVNVRVTNPAGTSSTGAANQYTFLTAPGAPTGATATAGDAQATVNFTAPASNGGTAITTYTATASPGGATGSCAGPAACAITVTGLTNGTAYTFTVTATNAIGTGSASTASSAVTPKAPQTITFGNPGAQNFGTSPTLTASTSSGLTPTFSSSTTGVCTITSGGTLTFVSAGTCTINADQAGNASFLAASTVTQSFSVTAVAPGAPTIGTATAGDGQVSVTFSAPASNGGAAITSYTVTSSPGGFTAVGASSPLTVTGLTNGTAYAFTVTATNSAGTGNASSASNSATPKGTQTITFANPGAQNFGTSPTLSATSDAGLSVTFSSSTTGVCTITPGGALTFITSGTCTIDADQAGNSTYLAAATVSRSFTVNAIVPGAPSIGTATAGDTQASITFTAPASSGGSSITGYTVTASPGGATGTGAASPITVTGLTNGVSYTFTVTATNSSGTGPASGASNSITPASPQTITFSNPGAQNFGTAPTLSATSDSGLTVTFTSSTTGVCTVTSGGALTFLSAGTCTINADQAGDSSYLAATQVSRSFTVNAVVPGAPTIGTATAGNTQASVTFSAPASNGGASITGYTVTSSPGGITATGAASPIVVTGLTNGTAYTFTVTATNSAGTGSASSASNSATPNNNLPGAPTGVSASGSNAQASITFTPPAHIGGSAISSYTVTASPGGATASGTASPIIVTGLTNGVAYTFTVVATNSYGDGPASTPSAAATPAAIAPNAPTAVSATAGDGQATISFTPPASNGGSAITGYTVTSSPGGASITGASSPVMLSGLTNGTTYTFTVTANNAIGSGTPSAPSNAVTPSERRADPTQDPTIRAIASHERETLRRFASAQIGNYMQRLEMLHTNGNRTGGMGTAFTAGRSRLRGAGIEDQSRKHFNANMPRAMQFRTPEIVATQGDLAIPDLATGTGNNQAGLLSGLLNNVVVPAAKTGNLHLNVASLMANEVPAADQESAFKLWGAGYVRIGKRGQQQGSESIDYSTDGVSFGADRRFMPNLTLGIGVGYARDKSDIGNEGSESTTSGNSIALYGSYQASPSVFIDGLLGYSTLDFESDRYVSAANDFARAERSGRQIFGSVSSGYEYRNRHMLFSPYARYDFSLDRLNAVTETGAGVNALHYGSQSSTAQALSLGMRAESMIETGFGLFMPRGRLEYQRHFEGGGNASLAYADQLGTTYSLAAANRDSNRLTLGAGGGLLLDNGLNLELNYQYMHSNQSEHSHGLFFGISKMLGGK